MNLLITIGLVGLASYPNAVLGNVVADRIVAAFEGGDPVVFGEAKAQFHKLPLHDKAVITAELLTKDSIAAWPQMASILQIDEAIVLHDRYSDGIDATVPDDVCSFIFGTGNQFACQKLILIANQFKNSRKVAKSIAFGLLSHWLKNDQIEPQIMGLAISADAEIWRDLIIELSALDRNGTEKFKEFCLLQIKKFSSIR